MRTDRSIIYHIYPLGFCAVEPRNGFASEPVNRISKISGWLPHIQSLGCDTLLLGPVWESSAHGYDTADFLRLDRRLGSNDDFRAVAEAVHAAGMNLVLDGVFNHVGRDFWAFRDVVEKRENSPYKDWFTVNFSLNNGFNDGLCYHAWEGCEDLVTLNLANPEVRRCLLDAVRFWIEAFGIDGLRLDVAYCLNMDFMRELRDLTAGLKPGFWLLGEVIKANYRRWLRPGLVVRLPITNVGRAFGQAATRIICSKSLTPSTASSVKTARAFTAAGRYTTLPTITMSAGWLPCSKTAATCRLYILCYIQCRAFRHFITAANGAFPVTKAAATENCAAVWSFSPIMP